MSDIRDSVEQLLMSARPTLTKEAEVNLFTILREKMAVVREVNEIDRRRTRAELCRRWHAQQTVARLRRIIAEANLPLVVAMAHKVKYTQLTFDEIVSEGTLILLRCIDRFDPGRGFKFSSYCSGALFKGFATLGHGERKHQTNRVREEYNPGESLDKVDVAAEIREVITIELDKDEARVMRARRGIGHKKGKTLNVALTAVKLRMSKRKVMRLYKSGLDKLEIAFVERGFVTDRKDKCLD